MREYRIEAAGSAINDTSGAMTGETYLDALFVHFSAAPTTSEYLVVTLDAAAGGTFDTVLYRLDPSVASTTDIYISPADFGVPLLPGDAIRTTYANTDKRTIGVRYVVR